MGQLESLKTITALGLLPDDIKDGIYQLSALSVVSLSPVVTSAALPENEVVWSEDLAEWTWPDRVHGTWLEIYEDGTWYVFTSSSLIVVHVDSLQLKVGVTVVGTGRVDAMLVRNHFPELQDKNMFIDESKSTFQTKCSTLTTWYIERNAYNEPFIQVYLKDYSVPEYSE